MGLGLHFTEEIRVALPVGIPGTSSTVDTMTYVKTVLEGNSRMDKEIFFVSTPAQV